MKQFISIYSLIALSLLCACSQDNDIADIHPSGQIKFVASLDESNSMVTRAEAQPLGYGFGEIAIKIFNLASQDTFHYEVINGYKGELRPIQDKQWHNWIDEASIRFSAWSAPENVSFTGGNTQDGIVDFSVNNTALEQFIGAFAEGDYSKSPSVQFPFKHLVC